MKGLLIGILCAIAAGCIGICGILAYGVHAVLKEEKEAKKNGTDNS